MKMHHTQFIENGIHKDLENSGKLENHLNELT